MQLLICNSFSGEQHVILSIITMMIIDEIKIRNAKDEWVQAVALLGFSFGGQTFLSYYSMKMRIV